MEKIEQQHSTKHLIVIAAIAEIFSSFTLWLIESPIKYPLFIIETLSIITIYAILTNYDLRFTLKKELTKRISSGIFLDILLICSSSILILIYHYGIGEGTIRLVLAFLCISGLSGFALLNVSRLTKYFSKLEILILSYLTSFIFSGFCSLILLWADTSLQGVIIPSLFILLGIASLLTHLKVKDIPKITVNSLSRNIDIIAIVVCIAFYAISFYYVYPNFTLLTNTDVSRHYRDSVILSRTPDLYSGFSYLLFHAFGSTFNIISGSPDMTSFLTIQILFNFLLPITVYTFAKRFLVEIDHRIPAISIIFYTFLSNFSFIYFTHLKLLGSGETDIQLLASDVAQKTYGSTVNFIQPFLWFVPLTVTFVLFIFAILLLKVWSIPRSRFIPLYTILILAMYLTHISDAVIFLCLLAIYFMVSTNKLLRLDDALFSSLIASIIAAIIQASTFIFWHSILRPGISLSAMEPVILPIMILTISILWRRAILSKIRSPLRSVNGKKSYLLFSLVFVTVYLFGFITWFFNNDLTSSVSDIGVVPWFIYPLMLGMVGLLALIAVRHFGYISSNNSLVFLLWSIVILFLIGRVLSLVNLDFIFTGYWEKRFGLYIFLFASLLAPLPLIKLMDQISMKKKIFTIIGSSVLISLVILLGFSSLALQLEYWVYSTNLYTMTQAEFQAITYLKNIFQQEPMAFTLTPSSSSGFALTLAVPPYQLPNPEVVFSSEKPEISLYGLSAHGLPHAYIYMNNRDFDMLNGKKSWFVNHLLPSLPVVFSNKEVTIYNATHVSYPRPNSDTHMIIPSDPSLETNSLFYAYDIISKHDRNYTVMFDRDQNALTSKTVVLSYDPLNNTRTDFYDKFSSLNNWRIVSGIWRTSTDGLHGGDVSGDLERVILSPVYSKNFTLDTSFKILGADPTVANYVSIIYSWIDPNNYKSAEITIFNQKVYVLFETTREGKIYSDSPWPGQTTNLHWAPNYLFSVNLSKQGNSEDLFLNGTKYLHRENLGESGYIGLGYTRVNDVVFDGIVMHKLSKLNLPEPLDYLSYVKSGGNLVVLNTNGYGSISDALFNIGTYSYNTSKIVMSSGESLPLNISALPLSATNNVAILSTYASPDNKSSILMADKTIGLGKITYVNIYPIIASSSDQKINATVLQKTFDKISSVIDLNKINPNLLNTNVKVNFKEMIGDGSVIVKTSSLVFPYDQLTTMTVENNGKKISISNVTNVNIKGYRYAILHGSHVSIANGSGLYGNAGLGNSMNIFFKNNATLTALSNNNKLYHFENVSTISIQNIKPIQVYLWQPEINNNGHTIFKQFIGSDVLGNIVTSRTDLNVSGNVSLTLFMSDTYTYGSSISATGLVKQPSNQQYNYDEIRSSISSLSEFNFTYVPISVDSLLLIPFIIAAILLLFGKSKNMMVKQI